MYRASQVIRKIFTSAGKEISVEFVTSTDAWTRTYLAPSRQTEFAAVVEKYKDTLRSDTERVAVKEAEHPSTNDPTPHYSVFELDKSGNVLASKHYYK
ncbi:hypothetical protein P154DRAFT_494170 [Amniculicola lignicola CBS 123094]|uniref:Uncharacterized protein n=1 Tax=Amniculicola lignicola CBS 123094 TaxID=1392246 RepID=A0A6A5WNE1_9PLEO|nr:hypothetical protein P154DRAFT_494170 [Amniculicola lignicola CBS 123094]